MSLFTEFNPIKWVVSILTCLPTKLAIWLFNTLKLHQFSALVLMAIRLIRPTFTSDTQIDASSINLSFPTQFRYCQPKSQVLLNRDAYTF